MIVVLLGFAAIAIDIARLTAEKSELQNGADAAAIAIAQNCAKGACGNTATTASTLAGANTNDGYATATASVAGSTVTVETGTLNKDGTTKIDYFFAPVLGIDSGTATATASAAWGNPASGPAMFPLTFSMCQFDAALSGTTQLIQYNTGPSCVGPTGHAIPGGFGWLKTPSGQCSLNISIATAQVASDNGNSFPLTSQCTTAMQSFKNQIILIPVFEQAGGSGASGWYKIYGFAAFKITGWKFGGNGSSDLNWNNTGTPSCTGNCRGIIGSFQRFIDISSAYTQGGPDLGAKNIKLTK
jgi:Flp pilus assembly protein TadG